MFVQVIKGRVNDQAGFRKQWEKWVEEVRPGAIGFLGSTSGLTDDGSFVTLARFNSAEDARGNSDRTEQSAWFAETVQYFDGDPTFHNCSEVVTWRGGGSDSAGFVQVMEGHASDPKRLGELNAELEGVMRKHRPDVIGGILAWHDGTDGRFTQTAYFTNEVVAREGEKRELPEKWAGAMTEMMSLMKVEHYTDLREPWFARS